MQETWTADIVTPTTRTEISATERIGALFDRQHERLYRLARRLSRDPEEARDLVQEAFLRVARRPASIPAAPDSEEAWMITVLVNLCRDRQRRRLVRERARPELRAAQEVGANLESAAIARLTVQKALARLSPRRRAAVVLHELEGLPVEKVSRLLGMARVTVRWHLSVARKEMARTLLDTGAPVGKRGRKG